MQFPRNNAFDILRLVAALQVCIVHCYKFFEIDRVTWDPIIDVLKWFPGVPIFFVISGFLITASWYRRGEGLKTYFISRFLRIFPALWLAVLISVVIVFVSGNYPSHGEFCLWLISQLTVLQIYNPDFLRDFGVGAINGSLWTIPVELCFYIFVPLFFIIFNKQNLKRSAVLLALCLLSFFVFVVAKEAKASDLFWGKLIYLTILSHLWGFLLGVFIYLYYKELRYLLEGRILIWTAIYLVFQVLWEFDLGAPQLLLERAILALWVISFAFSNTGVWGKLQSWIGGDYSYGLYLYHGLFINIFVHYGYNKGLSGLMVLLALAMLLAVCSWWFLERPVLSLKKRLVMLS